MFNPGPAPYGLPPIFLAGVGPRMTEVCGEVADGFFVHPFGTRRSFEELTLPALDRGLEASHRSPDAFSISLQVMVCTGKNDEEIDRARQATKQQIAFYGSTPAYRKQIRCIGIRYTSLEKPEDRFRRRAIHRSKAIVVSFHMGVFVSSGKKIEFRVAAGKSVRKGCRTASHRLQEGCATAASKPRRGIREPSRWPHSRPSSRKGQLNGWLLSAPHFCG